MMQMRKTLTLNDGVSLSVQASANHGCIPKEDNATAYGDVEVGFVEPPSAIPDSWAKWAEISSGENWKQETQIFTYLPASVLMQFILEHGGIASGEIPPLAFFGKPSMVEGESDE